jgi:hypothetical protein
MRDLKSLITEEHRHINPKYGVQSVEKNCGRWLMFSNHSDAIPFDSKDRRVVAIDNPTERRQSSYYERLFGLLDDGLFIASVWQFLKNRDISAFRPGEHAPNNAAKQRLLRDMMTEVERAVVEFMEDCQTELVSRAAIRDHVNRVTGSKVHDAHLGRAIAAAGMTITGRRVNDPETGKHSVVIVRGKWTVEVVAEMANDVLVEAMKVIKM